MQLVAQSSLEAVGPIADRRVVALPSNQVGLDPTNDRVIAAVHGGGSDALRLMAFRGSNADLERIGDNNPTGPIIGTPAITPARMGLLVTAVHGGGSNRLRLMSWRATAAAGGGTITRLGDSGTLIGEPNGSSDLTWVGGPLVAVALRTVGSDILRVILMDVTSDGRFSRRADSRHQAGRITAPPSICRLGPNAMPNGLPTDHFPGPTLVATAIRTSDGQLKVITWRIGGDGVARAGDSGDSGPRITGRPAIVAWPEASVIVAAAREAESGQLLLRAWQVAGNGALQLRATRIGSTMAASPGLAFAPDIPDASGEPRAVVATAIARPSGRLQVDRWHLERDGGSLTAIQRATTGSLPSHVAGSPSIVGAMTGTVAHTTGAAGNYYTVHREHGSNRLRVARWRPS